MFSIALFLYDYSLVIYLCACLFCLSTQNLDHWQARKIPFKKPLPVLGNLGPYVFRFRSFHQVVHDVYARFEGSPVCGFFQMREPVLLVRDPELAHTILVEDFSQFCDRSFNMLLPDKELNPLSTFMFMAKGDRWRALRKKLNPIFTWKKLQPIDSTLRSLLAKMNTLVDAQMVDGTADLDILHPYHKFLIDLQGLWALGIDCKTLEGNDEFLQVFKELMRLPLSRALTFLMPFEVRRRFRISDHSKWVTDFYYKVILDTVAYRRQHGVHKHDLLQQLMELQNANFDRRHALNEFDVVETEDERFDEVDIIANAVLMLISGIEEPLAVTAFCIYELAMNEHMQNELRKEVEAAYQANGGTLRTDWLESLKYMDAVVAETLRKYPVTPWVVRTNVEDYRIPHTDLVIEKNTAIMIPSWSIQHDEEYFSNPEQFDPMRFYGENKNAIRKGSYLPFGNGPRKCIGYRFALAIIKMAIADALLNYEFACCPKTDAPLTYRRTTIVLTPEKGIWIRLKKREI